MEIAAHVERPVLDYNRLLDFPFSAVNTDGVVQMPNKYIRNMSE
jgi:hypothetical protein